MTEFTKELQRTVLWIVIVPLIIIIDIIFYLLDILFPYYRQFLTNFQFNFFNDKE